MLITPKGLMRQEFLGEESHGLRLLHDFVESSCEFESLEFLMFALDGTENKDDIMTKLKITF